MSEVEVIISPQVVDVEISASPVQVAVTAQAVEVSVEPQVVEVDFTPQVIEVEISTGPAGNDGHSPVVAMGSGADADRVTVDGVPVGQHLTGPKGEDGRTVLPTSGIPGAGLGTDGDYAIDVSAQMVYGPKAAGAWPAGVSFRGIQGEKGDQGDQGIQGIQGVKGDKGDPGDLTYAQARRLQAVLG